jgi:hypothetical protein
VETTEESLPGSLGSRLNVFFDVLSLDAAAARSMCPPYRRSVWFGSLFGGGSEKKEWDGNGAARLCSAGRALGMRESETHGRSARQRLFTELCRSELVDG